MALDRRSFLQQTALAGAALAAPEFTRAESTTTAPAIGQSGKKDKLRLGFIGTGYRGQGHVELALMREDCEVVAFADPDARMVADCLKLFDSKGKKKPKCTTTVRTTTSNCSNTKTLMQWSSLLPGSGIPSRP